MHWGSRATDPGVHPPEVLVVGAHLVFQMCAPMLLIEVLTHPGTLGLYAQTARPLIWVHTDPGFGSVRWGSGASDQGVRPPGVSVVGAQSMIWVRANRDSGVCWGCLSGVHSPGAEGVGEQEATAAAESSLNSR